MPETSCELVERRCERQLLQLEAPARVHRARIFVRGNDLELNGVEAEAVQPLDDPGGEAAGEAISACGGDDVEVGDTPEPPSPSSCYRESDHLADVILRDDRERSAVESLCEIAEFVVGVDVHPCGLGYLLLECQPEWAESG